MALVDSNTYIEPTAGTSLSTARLQQNQNYRSLLSNFSGDGPPVGVNLTAGGNPLSVSGAGSDVDGMFLYFPQLVPKPCVVRDPTPGELIGDLQVGPGLNRALFHQIGRSAS